MSLSLEYQPRRSRRRHLQRASLLMLLCISLVVAAKRWGPSAWHRFQLTYWLHRCMIYSPPADQIVYQDGMASLLLTWEDGSPDVGASLPATTDNPNAQEREARCWNEFNKFVGIIAYAGTTSNILFLHERRDEKGRRWLVAIYFFERFRDTIDIGQLIISPEISGAGVQYTSGSAHMIVPSEYLEDRNGFDLPPKNLTFFAGQPDPKDSSRFSIRFKLGEYTGHIDYVLRGPSNDSSEPELDFAGGYYIYFDQPAPVAAGTLTPNGYGF